MPLTTDGFQLIACAMYVAVILLLGYLILCLILGAGERHWAQLLGLSFAAGSGAIALLLFDFSLAGFKPTRAILVGIATASALGLATIVKNGRLLRPSLPTLPRKIDPMLLLGVAAAATLIAATLNVQARAGWPGLGDIDAFAIWVFKAKWVALAPLRPIPPAFLDPGLSYSHQDYPLALPFWIAGIWAVTGVMTEQAAKSLLVPQYLALVAIIYSALRSSHRRATAVTLTAIFAAAPVLAQNAGLVVGETPLVLAYSGALVMLLRWMERGRGQDLLLAGFFSAVAAFTKNEGLALFPLMGLVALVFALTRCSGAPPAIIGLQSRRKALNHLIHWCVAAMVSLALIMPWLIFRNFLPRTHEDYGGKLRNVHTVIENLPRLRQILPGFLGQMFQATNAGLIWYVVIILALIGWRSFAHGPVRALWALLLGQLAMYIATFIVTPWPVDQLLGMISPKLLVQASPVAVLLIGLHLRSSTEP